MTREQGIWCLRDAVHSSVILNRWLKGDAEWSVVIGSLKLSFFRTDTSTADFDSERMRKGNFVYTQRKEPWLRIPRTEKDNKVGHYILSIWKIWVYLECSHCLSVERVNVVEEYVRHCQQTNWTPYVSRLNVATAMATIFNVHLANSLLRLQSRIDDI